MYGKREMGTRDKSGMGEVTVRIYNVFIYLNLNVPLSQEVIICPHFIWKKLYLQALNDCYLSLGN